MEFSTLNGYNVKDKKAIRYYDNVASMKSDTTLKEGMYVKTKGYSTINDNGALEYYITSTQSNTEYQEELNNGLYANSIIENIIRYYDNVASMKSDTTLKEGMYVKTKGYYQINDKGSSEYVIVNDNTLIDDGGSIHTLDNGLKAKLINNGCVSVNQFGAKGDNVTDDSTAIQNAINYAGAEGFKDVILTNYRYYCASGLEITYPEFKLHGQPLTEYGNSIRFSTDVSVGIDVKNYGFKMENICLLTTKETTNSVVGLRIVRPTGEGTYEERENAMNLDADINNCAFLWLYKAIYVKGRNVNVDTCEFGECQNGFELDKLAEGHSHRDIWIRNCRFHNIGAYQRETLGYEYGFAIIFPSVWTRADTYGNIIRNNFFDYCNNIFTGCILGSTISDNNILDCLHDGIVAVNPNDTTINSNNNIEVLISNNNINLRGDASNYGIYLKGVGRPRITGNIIANQPTIAVLLEKCSTIWFTNNNLNCTRADITENLKIIGASGDEVFLADNMFASFQNANNTYVNISGVSKIYTGGNVEVGSSTAIVTNVTPLKQGEDAHFW